VLEDDIKNREHSDPDYILDARLRKISDLETELRETKRALVNMELKLEHMRSDYHHEPTN
jgi:ribosomal protein L29